jgi:hypothetical protein
MPRNNDAPVLCWKDFENKIPACRFVRIFNEEEYRDYLVKVKGECWRDPVSQICWKGKGCFAGELIVQRSCLNCDESSYCSIYQRLRGTMPLSEASEWHCSDWKAKE